MLPFCHPCLEAGIRHSGTESSPSSQRTDAPAFGITNSSPLTVTYSHESSPPISPYAFFERTLTDRFLFGRTTLSANDSTKKYRNGSCSSDRKVEMNETCYVAYKVEEPCSILRRRSRLPWYKLLHDYSTARLASRRLAA